MRGLAIALVVAACTSGPPPGYSGGNGDSWTFPLIGPLEDGLLLAPVTVNNKGPYVFAIDPDAVVTIVDEQVVKEAGLRLDDGHGARMLDESDTKQIRFYAEVLNYEIGTLVVQGGKPALVVKAGTFDTNGRRIHGVLGRNVLSDSLVFGFDRDLGLGYLTAAGSFRPPPNATVIPYENVPSRIQNAEVIPIPRRLVKGTIFAPPAADSGPSGAAAGSGSGANATFHLDLGATTSTYRESLWSKRNLTPQDQEVVTLDEVGSSHKSSKVVTASVVLGGVKSAPLTLVPYADKRWDTTDVDGTLGLDFFRPLSVWVDLDTHKYFVAPRKDVMDTAKQRLSRWDLAMKCEHPGCVAVKIIDPLQGKPAEAGRHPGVVVSIVRDPPAGGTPFEATIFVKPELPWLIVNMPANVDRVMDHEGEEFVGADPQVIDVGLYPRRCPNGGGCVDRFNPQTAARVAKTPALEPACKQLLDHITDLELAKSGVTGDELAKQKAAIVQSKSAEFLETCTKQTSRARIDCALAAPDLDAVAKCDAK
jgi:hypothetical protein